MLQFIAVLGGPCCIPSNASAAALLQPRVDAALDLIRSAREKGCSQVLLIVTGSARSSFVSARTRERKRRRDGTGTGPTIPVRSHGEYLRTALASALLEAGLGIGEPPAVVRQIVLDDGCTDLLAMADASLNFARMRARPRMDTRDGAGVAKMAVVTSEFALARARAAFDAVADGASIEIEYVAGVKVPAAALPHSPDGSSTSILARWARCEEMLMRNWLPLRCEMHKYLRLQPKQRAAHAGTAAAGAAGAANAAGAAGVLGAHSAYPSSDHKFLSPDAWLALVQRAECAARDAIATLSSGVHSDDDADAVDEKSDDDDTDRLPCGCDPSTMLCMHDKEANAKQSDARAPSMLDDASLPRQRTESLTRCSSDSTSRRKCGCDPRTMLCLHGDDLGDKVRRNNNWCDAAQEWLDESTQGVRQCGCDYNMLCLHRFGKQGQGQEARSKKGNDR